METLKRLSTHKRNYDVKVSTYTDNIDEDSKGFRYIVNSDEDSKEFRVSMVYMADKGKKNYQRKRPFLTQNASSNFSNFRNYPNYFRFPIYKFISQKIFSSFLYLPIKRDERHKN